MAAKLWAGLDIGSETTAICVINDTGEVLQETTCPTDLRSVHREIKWLRRRRHVRVGLECSTGSTLARGLRGLGYSVDMYETLKLSKFLRVRRNKTDAGDAIGIAEAGRIGASLLSKVYLKSLECQVLQSRLAIRRHLVRARVAAVHLLCRQLEHYGGRISRGTRSMRLRENVEAEIARLFCKTSISPASELLRLLDYSEQLLAHQYAIDSELRRLASEIEICRRFMEIPGVGMFCALTFYAVVGDPHRFQRAVHVGSYLGLTPKLHESGLTKRHGRISKMGNTAARTLLVHAAQCFMRSCGDESPLRAWAKGIEQRRGRGPARVALARKLAVIMLAIWKSGEQFEQRALAPAQ